MVTIEPVNKVTGDMTKIMKLLDSSDKIGPSARERAVFVIGQLWLRGYEIAKPKDRILPIDYRTE